VRGGRALVGTTTEELHDECEDDVLGGTMTATVRLAVQRYHDQAGPSNKASRSIAGRALNCGIKILLLWPFQSVLFVAVLVCGGAPVVPEVPVDPLFPEHREKCGEEGTGDAGVEWRPNCVISGEEYVKVPATPHRTILA